MSHYQRSSPTAAAPAAGDAERDVALAQFRAVRATTERLVAPLTPEDQGLQSMPEASPARWHLAHTTWFFETFVLAAHAAGYAPYDARYTGLFNSYYETLGAPFARAARGLLSRPGSADVLAYRAAVDVALERLIADCAFDAWPAVAELVTLGLHHEQQHRELILTDIRHAFFQNPLHPPYRRDLKAPLRSTPVRQGWREIPGGICEVGAAPGESFAFDCERPRHRAFLRPFRIATRPVTNAEYAAFIGDGGYDDSRWWLADGIAAVRAQGWCAPLYWSAPTLEATVFDLAGTSGIDADAPVCNVSFFEADAYARWAGRRLPTEVEWEVAAATGSLRGNLLENDHLRPVAARASPAGAGLLQMFGDVWEWTQSAYAPYPGYRAPEGAIGEYNGKFMSGQMVLRGGSCATPSGHLRPSYRNFFPPTARWQFAGLRLAEDA